MKIGIQQSSGALIIDLQVEARDCCTGSAAIYGLTSMELPNCSFPVLIQFKMVYAVLCGTIYFPCYNVFVAYGMLQYCCHSIGISTTKIFRSPLLFSSSSSVFSSWTHPALSKESASFPPYFKESSTHTDPSRTPPKQKKKLPIYEIETHGVTSLNTLFLTPSSTTVSRYVSFLFS